ncbi:hypothetical protein Hanom_Chr16g01481141 [Helianthus anomalus]
MIAAETVRESMVPSTFGAADLGTIERREGEESGERRNSDVAYIKTDLNLVLIYQLRQELFFTSAETLCPDFMNDVVICAHD